MVLPYDAELEAALEGVSAISLPLRITKFCDHLLVD